MDHTQKLEENPGDWSALLGILCGIMILSFYNVVAGWAFGYFIEIMFGSLLSQSDYGAFFTNYVNDFWDNLIFSLCLHGYYCIERGPRDKRRDRIGIPDYDAAPFLNPCRTDCL